MDKRRLSQFPRLKRGFPDALKFCYEHLEGWVWLPRCYPDLARKPVRPLTSHHSGNHLIGLTEAPRRISREDKNPGWKSLPLRPIGIWNSRRGVQQNFAQGGLILASLKFMASVEPPFILVRATFYRETGYAASVQGGLFRWRVILLCTTCGTGLALLLRFSP